VSSSGTLGAVSAQSLISADFSAVGTLTSVTTTGDIGASGSLVTIAVSGANGHIGTVSAATIYANISTTGTSGNRWIESVKTTSGNFVGSLTTQYLDVSSDSLPFDITGDLAADVSFTVDTYRRMHVGGDLIGSITVGHNVAGGAAGGLTIDGDLTGSVSVENRLTRPIVVEGDVTSTGMITIGESTSPQQSSSNVPITVNGQMAGVISIGLSLSAGTDITGIDIEPVGGLSGQIIINASNSTGTWSNDVVIDGDAVSPTPDYDQPAWVLGGGAIGLAPFNCNDADCDPENEIVMDDSRIGDGLESVFIRHYGPVNFTGDFPFVVLESEIPAFTTSVDGSNWTCCGGTTTCETNTEVPITPVDVSSHLAATVNPDNPREVIISSIDSFLFTVWHVYCIKPIRTGGDKLYCDQVSGSPAVADYTYRFIIAGSVFDLNRSGTVEYADAAMWLDHPVDFNGDESADAEDLAELIEAIPE
jgi:hypothetical protein